MVGVTVAALVELRRGPGEMRRDRTADSDDIDLRLFPFPLFPFPPTLLSLLLL